jgi:hypothetical protein
VAIPQLAGYTNEPRNLLKLVAQQTEKLPAPPPEPTSTFSQYFSVLFPALETWLTSKPEYIEEEQQEGRFKGETGDNAWIRVSKAGKQTAYWASRLPTQVGNRFRKEARPARMWMHRIPWRNMLRQHIMVYMLRELQPLVQSAEQLQQELLLAARDASEIPHRAYTDSEAKQLRGEELEKKRAEWQRLLQKSRELQRYIEGEAQVILRRLNERVTADYPKAGTFELPEPTFAYWRTEKMHQNLLQSFNSLWQEWQQAHRALISQWQLRMAIYTTVYNWQIETGQLRQTIAGGLSEDFWPAFNSIQETLSGLKKKVAQQELTTALNEARQLVREQFKEERIQEIISGLIKQDLAGKVQRLEGELALATEALPEQTTVAKNGKLNESLRQAELANIQPRQLIKLEVLPKTADKLVELKVSLVQGVEDARVRLLEMEDVCLFNLDSAGAYLQDHPEEVAKAQSIAFEGLDRTINQTRHIEQQLQDLEQEVPKKIEVVLGQLYSEVLNLRQADNLWSLQLRLLKAKAMQRSGSLLEDLESRFGTRIPAAIKQLESGLRWTRRQRTQLKSRLGLEAAPPSIATEVTDFLQENENALQRLPFVYRRLYNTDSLQEELFFVGRRPELATLQHNYTRWKEGKYAALLITGERGSGISSLLNIFQKKLPAQQKVVRLELPTQPLHPAQLYNAISSAFELPPASSLPELIDSLKSTSEPTVVIVEDIQRLMFRKVGGFSFLKEFFSIVAATNRKLCWVAGCKLYAWQYISKATGGADSWSQVMAMQAFTQEQLHNLIMQRHRVSGYQLIFEPSEQELKSKKFAALNAEEQQRYLSDKFFKKLAAFAQSNLRLALLYWLRSTLSVSKNAITLSTSLNPEFSFLNNLATDKYFTLHSLLLHDFLPSNSFAELMSINPAAGRHKLQTLYDVGLLIQRPELGYGINPLLYRQIVNVLKHRNLIH